jgi:Raf kinase inhibitor-like YbhB/YbcL family protein
MSIHTDTRRRSLGSSRAPALGLVSLLALVSVGCSREPAADDDPTRLTITLRSPAFVEGGMIPKEYTCDGAGGSPPLQCTGVPSDARELALIVDDPDAPMGTFSHWVVVGLPPGLKGLKEGVPAEAIVPTPSILSAGEGSNEANVRQGKNDFGKTGYGGPCPPSGTHRYIFRLYALDAPVGSDTETPTRSVVLQAVKGHILAEGRLVGRYARTK